MPVWAGPAASCWSSSARCRRQDRWRRASPGFRRSTAPRSPVTRALAVHGGDGLDRRAGPEFGNSARPLSLVLPRAGALADDLDRMAGQGSRAIRGSLAPSRCRPGFHRRDAVRRTSASDPASARLRAAPQERRHDQRHQHQGTENRLMRALLRPAASRRISCRTPRPGRWVSRTHRRQARWCR